MSGPYPSVAGRLLAAFLPFDRRDDLLGDLEEEYQVMAAREGVTAAGRWYRAQILKSMPSVAERWLLRCAPSLWASAGALAPSPTDTVGWIGKAFLLFAVGWIAATIWLLGPDLPGAAPRGLPGVVLPGGPTFQVDLPASDTARSGWVGAVKIQTQCPCWITGGWPGEDHFFMTALAPPFAILFAALIWLAASDRFRRHGMSGAVIARLAHRGQP